MSQPFVSTAWLQEHLNDPDLVVVDGSWYLPTQNRDPQAEYLAGHIPGAVRFDIDSVKDTSSALPHMLPAPDNFAQAAGAMGIGEDTTIVVYDGAGLFSAPRVRWTFRVFGARNVSILEGGFPAWKAEGRPVETGPENTARPSNLQAFLQPGRGRGCLGDPGGAAIRCGAGRRCPARQTVSAAKPPSRAPACAPAIFREASTCPSARSSRTDG